MNHILVRNRRTGTALAPQGVDRFYPYAENLTVAEGNLLLAADLTAGLALSKLIAAMPGTNRLRVTDGPTDPLKPVLLYLGRNGSGNGMGTLSVYTNGPGAGQNGQELYAVLIATGSTPAYSSTPVKLGYKAEGWPRDGLIPVADLQHYAGLLSDVPNGTYTLQTRSAVALLNQKAIEVTNDGPELAIRVSDTTTTTPTIPADSASTIYVGGSVGAVDPGSDDSGQAWNTSPGQVLTEN